MTALADAQADAVASEILTPEMRKKIKEAIQAINAGNDPALVLSVLVSMAYLDGMIAMSKVGFPQ